jgi:hypothetical protein
MDKPDGDINEYVTFDYAKARVSARVDIKSSNDAIELVNRVNAYVAEAFPAGVAVTVTGLLQLYAHMEEYIRSNMIRGFGSALVAIYLVFCLQLRSPGLAAIAMIPNVLPILMTVGVMGFAGIRLDSMTTMVASIAIGLAVDDTIHFLDRVSEHTSHGRPIVEALRESTLEVGRAISFTSLALCAGFGVMLFASFIGTFYFGLLSLLAIIFGRAADLLLLPVLLRWYMERPARAHRAVVARSSASRVSTLEPQASIRAIAGP